MSLLRPQCHPYRKTFSYIDDIVGGADSLDELMVIFQKSLKLLQDRNCRNIKFKPNKVIFGFEEIDLLGSRMSTIL